MTMAYVAVAVSVIGAAVSATSQVMAADNARKVANYNATMQERAADDAQQRGAIQAAEHRDKVRKMISRQNAAGAANGIQIDSGSALDLVTETAGKGELDALRITDNAQRTASGLEASADLEIYKGAAAERAGYMNAAGTVLSSAGSIGSYGSKAGMFGGGQNVNGTLTIQ